MSTTRNPSIEIQTPPAFDQRLFEILPGLTMWGFFIVFISVSFTSPTIAALLVIAFDLFWLTKSIAMSARMLQGYNRLKTYTAVNWRSRLDDLENIDSAIARHKRTLNRSRLRITKQREARYISFLQQLLQQKDKITDTEQIYNAVIIATYNESYDVLKPTMESVRNSDFPNKRIIVMVAYEERGGPETEKVVNQLIREYGDVFYYCKAVKHPDGTPGEVQGKGANITYAGRELKAFVDDSNIPFSDVIVTTLDADNRPAKNYFDYLTFTYCTVPDRKHKSFQPIAMFYNNIWDVPAPMRVLATGNSFWNILQSVRPHLLRNFSAHAQPLEALIDTDFWSTKTIVEDGHQFWRTYFRYDGNHRVVALYTPIYQDAVLAETYPKTFKVQFKQIRRWAWGVSDIPYVYMQFKQRSNIPINEKLNKFFRLYEGHFSWAVAPIFLAVAAWIPLLFNHGFTGGIVVHQLPIITSWIQTLATLGIVVALFLSVLSLPPRPEHRRKSRSIAMVFQWILLPATSIIFGSLAAFNSQTRLMLGKYLEKFEVTDKAVHKSS